jgi:hypothetical protein
MIKNLIFIERKKLDVETLRSFSLGDSKQLVIENIAGVGLILHIPADSPAYLRTALIESWKPQTTEINLPYTDSSLFAKESGTFGTAGRKTMGEFRKFHSP